MRNDRRIRPANPGDLLVSPTNPGGLRPFPHSPKAIVEDEDSPISKAFLQNEISRLVKHLRDISNYFASQDRVVDEYPVQSLGPDSQTSMIWNAEYEVPITVRSVLVTGPAGAYTLQLGKRVWTLTMPAAGYQVIGPVLFSLGRNDLRQLTSLVAGDWAVEVMGTANADWALR